MLIQLTNNISSGSILFNDIHLTQKTISGTLSWTIPGDLTNITHFEGYLSIDQNGTQHELNNIFIVNNTINSIIYIYIESNLYIYINIYKKYKYSKYRCITINKSRI